MVESFKKMFGSFLAQQKLPSDLTKSDGLFRFVLLLPIYAFAMRPAYLRNRGENVWLVLDVFWIQGVVKA